MTATTFKRTRVINIKTHGQPDIYIGRPSRWGNPYVIGRDGNRDEVIAKYRDYVLNTPELMAVIHTLQGKTLGCFCAPLPCHGQILAELADGEAYS